MLAASFTLRSAIFKALAGGFAVLGIVAVRNSALRRMAAARAIDVVACARRRTADDHGDETSLVAPFERCAAIDATVPASRSAAPRRTFGA
jgi:hypothetical protein